MSEPHKLLLTIDEAAKSIGMSKTWIKDLIRNGSLKSVHLGRMSRVPAEALEQYVRSKIAGGDGSTVVDSVGRSYGRGRSGKFTAVETKGVDRT